jgi:ABC-type oligopeptide transport system substrate-binding subunit
MKKAIVSAILVAIFAMSIASSSNAFYYPGAPPTDDGKWNNFGPMTQNLILKPYASQEGEYLAFKACDLDFMDWSLLSTQVDELNTLDPSMATYARAFYVDRGMREFDFNCMRFPTDDVAFRRALQKMFDKDTFVATQLAGYAARMDSPLTNHGAYYNPYCTNLYPYDLAGAQTDLNAAGYVDSDADGWREGPLGDEVILDIYIRSDDPDRDVMGTIMCTNIRACGIQTNEQHQPRSVCQAHCMKFPFDYNIYTGGWSFGRDPDVLYSLYLSDYAQAFDGTPNYNGYQSATFDLHANGMLTAATIGDSVTPSTAMYHTWEMQRVLMDDSAVMPVFTYASYGSYKTGWEKVVNQVGVGPWGWYTFMSTSKPGTDTVVWGQMNDITDWNVIHSQWVWDWNLMALIYDGLINVNPYNPAQDLPWLAQSWTVGEWNSPLGLASTIEFKLREDVYWQDVPAKADRVTPNGVPFLTTGATNVKFTADDVVFSILAVKNIPDSWNNALCADVVYAEALDPYTVKVYMDLLMPLWALHWVGGLPIMPKHVWQPIYNEGTTKTFDAIAQKVFVGTGPWQYDYAASVLHSQYVLHAYPRFFRYHPIDVFMSMANYKVVLPCTTIGPIAVYAHNWDMQRPTIPAGTFSFTITYTPYVGAPTIIGPISIDVPLPYCSDVLIYEIPAIHVPRGLATWKVVITADPLTGHTDADGWTEYVYATIPEDINLDFFVNAKDAVALGAAFGSTTTSTNWNPACDINGDGFVNAKDAVKLGAMFGWAGP